MLLTAVNVRDSRTRNGYKWDMDHSFFISSPDLRLLQSDIGYSLVCKPHTHIHCHLQGVSHSQSALNKGPLLFYFRQFPSGRKRVSFTIISTKKYSVSVSRGAPPPITHKPLNKHWLQTKKSFSMNFSDTIVFPVNITILLGANIILRWIYFLNLNSNTPN